MIGLSDLNRLPRYVPARASEDLLRYAKDELGGEDLGFRARLAVPREAGGLRAWLTSAVRRAPATPSPIRASTVTPRAAAVHFLGEEPEAPRPVAVFATSATIFREPTQDGCREELHVCEQ